MTVLGDDSFEARSPDELLAWIREERRPFVLLSLLSSDDWTLLTQLSEVRPDTTVIAVLADTSLRSQVHAIRGGAVAAVPRDAMPETLRKVFEAAVAGESLLPVEVVRALTSGQPMHEEDDDILTPEQIGWLRELAYGTTVARLADRAGYSERAMFRLLRELYRRIGARNRVEALMRAQERGWL
jgi:DNA-binding NarL/FixJ family response regulator